MIGHDELPDLSETAREALEKYGIGIPATLTATAITLGYVLYPGVDAWETLTPYGRLGVAVIAASAAVCLFAAGFTYARLDTAWWLLTEEEDAQEPVSFDFESEPDAEE